jgi:hypothetical protein
MKRGSVPHTKKVRPSEHGTTPVASGTVAFQTPLNDGPSLESAKQGWARASSADVVARTPTHLKAKPAPSILNLSSLNLSSYLTTRKKTYNWNPGKEVREWGASDILRNAANGCS